KCRRNLRWQRIEGRGRSVRSICSDGRQRGRRGQQPSSRDCCATIRSPAGSRGMSQFTFLQSEWATVFEAASKAESAVHADPRTACFYARRALELAVSWAFKHDAGLKLPYQDNLSALIHEPSFKQTAGEAVFSKARVINTLGNRAVHNHRPVPKSDALAAVRELFHVAY